jgi:hypothetical protein
VEVEDVMISLRNLAVIGGCLALLSVAAVAQPAADGALRGPQEASAAAPQKPPAAPRPAKAGAPMGSPSHGPGGVIRPASAVPPERIQVEPAPGARPQLPPQDDPRSVEEDKGEPDATDR